MNNILYGEKARFAIELRITKLKPNVFGNTYLWLNGIPVGYFYEENLVGPVREGLKHMKRNLNVQRLDLIGLTPAKAFSLLNSDPNGYYHHVLDLGEGYSDFLIQFYAIKNEIYFVWRLVANPFFTYANMTRKIHGYSVPALYIDTVLNSFIENTP